MRDVNATVMTNVLPFLHVFTLIGRSLQMLHLVKLVMIGKSHNTRALVRGLLELLEYSLQVMLTKGHVEKIIETHRRTNCPSFRVRWLSMHLVLNRLLDYHHEGLRNTKNGLEKKTQKSIKHANDGHKNEKNTKIGNAM